MNQIKSNRKQKIRKNIICVRYNKNIIYKIKHTFLLQTKKIPVVLPSSQIKIRGKSDI